MMALLFGILFIFVYSLLGLGTILLVRDDSIRRYSLLLAPLIGYSFASVLGWYFYRAGLPGVNAYAGYVLMLSILPFMAILKKEGWRSLGVLFNGEVLAVYTLLLLVMLILLVPYFREGVGLTSISWHNHDIADSATVSKYLQEFPRTISEGFVGTSASARVPADTVLFGGPFSTALVASLFHLQPYQIQSLGIVSFFIMGLMAFYFMLVSVFKYRAVPGLFVLALTGISPVILYGVYNGFQGQIIGMGLSLAMMGLYMSADHEKPLRNMFDAKLWVFVLLSWGMSVTYNHMLPVVYMLLFGFGIIDALFGRRDLSRLARGLEFLVIAVALTALLSLYRAGILYQSVMLRGFQEAGWHIPVLSLDVLLGFTLNRPNLSPHALEYQLGAGIPLGLAMAYGLWRTWTKDRRVFCLSTYLLAAVLVGYAVFCLAGRSENGYGGYRSYKWISFYLPVLLACAFLALRDWRWEGVKIRGLAPVILAAGLLAGNLFSARFVMESMIAHGMVVTRDMAELETIEKDRRVESVNILGTDWWNILWATYFLMRKPLYFETTTYAGREASELKGDWDLITLTPGAPEIGGTQTEDMMRINARYYLQRRARPAGDSSGP